MFGVLKMLFYTFVAVVVGVFIGTMPVGGRTIAERITGLYQVSPAESPGSAKRRPVRGEPSRGPARKQPKSPAALAASPPVPTSAGAANAPEGHSADDEKALERLIAARSKAR